MTQKMKKSLTGYLFSAPFVLGMLVFVFIPAGLSLYYSFCDYAMITPPEFIGAGNYVKLITDEIFTQGLKNTLHFAVLFAPGMTLISLFFALLLHSVTRVLKGRVLAVVGAFFYFPSIAPWAIIGTLWMYFLNKDFGIINRFIAYLGFERVAFLAPGSSWFIPSAVMAAIWKGLGYMMFIYFAGLKSISPHYYEAAEVDGATFWQKIRYITIPLLTPTTFCISIIATLWAFNTFEQFYVMGSAMTDADLEPLNTLFYSYQMGFRYFKMGYSVTITWVLFAITASVTLLQNRFQKYWVNY